ncbi:hypothetical protein TYRP_021565 [Tyrophagus putrescentiae]|nr:hypothetical protein TYRP_021565 [Tyrophagus putrescentiae]
METIASSLCNDSAAVETTMLALKNSSSSVAALSEQCLQDFFIRSFYDFLQMFYIVWPSEGEEPEMNYELNLIPMASVFIVIEQVIRIFQRQDLTRVQDLVTNVGSAIVFLFSRILFLGMIIHVYFYIHDNYRIVDMPLHNFWSWLISLLLVEFVYYWTHRALHEFNFLWAAHQFHHMAEDLNVSTAIRDSVVDLILYDIFPLPLSFLIPPQILVVHMQFSLIYQIWLHNSVIGDLGFFEYIHLVHHGKNPYCIDKNYGALLMIWDRLFGTYQREKKEDKLVFGVVSPTPATFDPLVLQFGYYRDVYRKFMAMETAGDKVSALVKGPGWSPGKPRLGLLSDVPEPDRDAPKYTYDPEVSVWTKLYVGLHGLVLLIGLYAIGHHLVIRFTYLKATVAMLFIITTLTSFGFIFDSRKFAPLFETARCLLYYPIDYYIAMNTPWDMQAGDRMIFDIYITGMRLFFLASAVIWLIRAFTGGDEERNNLPQVIQNGNGVVTSKGEEASKTDNNSGEKGENIELAKKLRAKHSSKGFNLANITASLVFLVASLVVTYVLYFVRLESCNKLINMVD